ncbi:MAG: tRNA 2-thiouridine(34) synthase MnmA [Bdellovibrionales bacterium]|nr:tRNA 2-thiouridine(34) synthase MnmA [Bdellovibrionales bacterium]
MSGGVDSAVAAALLVEQGYDVIGVTMQVWDYSSNSCDIQEGNGTCCSSIDVDDARAVADKLNIPFYVINCEAKFQAYVIDDFISSYLEGRTPIPCVNCNTYLKFDHLIQKMQELECDYLATGHYAQVTTSPTGRPAIQTSKDDGKDQTYFLFTLNPKIIPQLLFPIGNMEKSQVRKIAESKGLDVAKKKDSTGLCFIGKEGHAQFISKHVAPELLNPGEVKLYPSGEVLGTHQGIHQFTYGQRKGMGIAHNEPLYVVKLDPRNHVVWLGEEKHLFAQKLVLKNPNWLDEMISGEPLRIKIRYHHRGAQAILKPVGDRWHVYFDEPQRAITPGQAAVVYRSSQLLGGGWIESLEKK